MQAQSDCRRLGSSLVEILIVIAIIAIVAGLAIPGIQAARNAANRTYNQNNLKQMLIAENSLYAVKGTFGTHVEIAAYMENQGKVFIGRGDPTIDMYSGNDSPLSYPFVNCLVGVDAYGNATYGVLLPSTSIEVNYQWSATPIFTEAYSGCPYNESLTYLAWNSTNQVDSGGFYSSSGKPNYIAGVEFAVPEPMSSYQKNVYTGIITGPPVPDPSINWSECMQCMLFAAFLGKPPCNTGCPTCSYFETPTAEWINYNVTAKIPGAIPEPIPTKYCPQGGTYYFLGNGNFGNGFYVPYPLNQVSNPPGTPCNQEFPNDPSCHTNGEWYYTTTITIPGENNVFEDHPPAFRNIQGVNIPCGPGPKSLVPGTIDIAMADGHVMTVGNNLDMAGRDALQRGNTAFIVDR